MYTIYSIHPFSIFRSHSGKTTCDFLCSVDSSQPQWQRHEHDCGNHNEAACRVEGERVVTLEVIQPTCTNKSEYHENIDMIYIKYIHLCLFVMSRPRKIISPFPIHSSVSV